MFIYNGHEYDNVWFTSDEHYNSNRHIVLSCRLGIGEKEIKEKIIREYKAQLEKTDIPKNIQKAILSQCVNCVYGLTNPDKYPDQLTEMNNLLIDNHNKRVGDNDLVFHVGDFGDYEYANQLNGHHILILGNYEVKDINDNYNKSFDQFRDYIISNYNFIDVINEYTIDLDKIDSKVFSSALTNEVSKIYIGHMPIQCKYSEGYKLYKDENDKYIMNAFGHIHEKGKIKRFGVNVGVDGHHYYPMASEEVDFYLYAILHYYDEDVFC